jgi:NAD(P)H-dependent FMN reductase
VLDIYYISPIQKLNMHIVAISGSASENSSNTAMLKAIQSHFSDTHDIEIIDSLRDFPLFRPEDLEKTIPKLIQEFKQKIIEAEAVIICTPEYTHNIPAVLKNGLEWITASGELADKRVLPITFTPKEPRGEYAMQSLLNSLKTMNAKIVTELPLYKSEVEFEGFKIKLSDDYTFLIGEGLKLL